MQSCVIRKKLRITELLLIQELRSLRLQTGKQGEVSRKQIS